MMTECDYLLWSCFVAQLQAILLLSVLLPIVSIFYRECLQKSLQSWVLLSSRGSGYQNALRASEPRGLLLGPRSLYGARSLLAKVKLTRGQEVL